MALMRWRPLNLSTQWPDVWDDDFFSSMTTASNNLDVYETDEEVVVKANVAGVPEDTIDLTFEKGVLWIRAELEEEEEDTKKKHYSKSSWSYSYKVAVPGQIDFTKDPEAEVEDGVLTVRFKKSEASKPRKLEVKKKSKK